MARPVADWLGKVVFFAVPLGEAQLPLIMAWLIMGGIVCTLAFRFVNLRGFRHSPRVIRGDYSKRDHPGEATPFQALSTAVSGTVGLGSIGGVAVAVTLGGPGAAFWMMIAGFLGMSTKFAEVTLAVKYRLRARGRHGVRRRHVLRARSAEARRPAAYREIPRRILLRGRGGRLADHLPGEQSYSQLNAVTGFDQACVFGLIVAVWIGIVLFGGVKRIVKWTDKLSPFMCLLYVAACLVVLGANYANMPAALATIFHDAFAPNAITGGVMGALIQGFRRASFANEAGIGSAPMAHATVRTQRAHVAGLRGADGALPRHHRHLPADRAGGGGQRRVPDQSQRGHRADFRRVRHRGAVVPDRARGGGDPVRAVDRAFLGLLRRAGLDVAVQRRPGAAAWPIGCSCARCCSSRRR